MKQRQLTFRLAFMSSMLSLSMMAGFIPGMGIALGLLPLLLVWTVSGFRYAALMEGITILTQLPSFLANLLFGATTSTQAAVRIAENPDILTKWLLTLPVADLYLVFFGLLFGTFAYTVISFYFIVKSLRRMQRLKPVLVRLGAIEP